MGSKARLPALPHGSSSVLYALSETFSFHSSPEAFITSRVLAFRSSNPNLAELRTPIRAKVLNRDVAVVSSFDHVHQVLCESDEGQSCPFSAGQAYDELMAPFFPPLNLLLSDPPTHGGAKRTWEARMALLVDSSKSKCQEIASAHFQQLVGSSVDIYQSMKDLAWKMLLSLILSSTKNFLNTKIEREESAQIECLQEILLRGQFSLLPLSIDARVWRSPRSKGLQASKKLKSAFKERLRSNPKQCPFAPKNAVEEEDVANHTLLFTSSLAAKALASYLTALLLNLYIYPWTESRELTLAKRLTVMSDDFEREELLRSICLETERLSPPVVGIMRRTTRDVVLNNQEDGEGKLETLIPKGWDVWLYFVGAARDPAAFGSRAETFEPTRYSSSSPNQAQAQEGFAFGAGPKSCLGKHLVREIAMTVTRTCLNLLPGNTAHCRYDLSVEGKEIPPGVKAWLGWQSNVSPEQWAKDMKQLPTQRPAQPIRLGVYARPMEATQEEEPELEFYDAQEYLE